MTNTITDFKTLSIAERTQLVEDIWDSIAAEAPDELDLSPMQRVEIARRLEAHRLDPDSAVSWDQVRAELFDERKACAVVCSGGDIFCG